MNDSAKEEVPLSALRRATSASLTSIVGTDDPLLGSNEASLSVALHSETTPTLLDPPGNAPAILESSRRPLPSYVSEPPSKLLALRAMAQEEMLQIEAEHKAADAAAKDGFSGFYQSKPSSPSSGRPSPRDDNLRSDLTWFNNPTAAANEQPSTTKATGKVIQHTIAGDLAVGGVANRPFIVINPKSRDPSPQRSPAKPPVPPPSATKPKLARKPSKSTNDMDDENDRIFGYADVDVDEEEEEIKLPFYQRKRFWSIFIPLFIAIGFIISGTCILVYEPEALTSTFETWRLCFFIGVLPFIWWLGDLFTWLLVWIVKHSKYKDTYHASLYFIYDVRDPLKNVLRSAFALGWWALIMTVDNDYSGNNKALRDAYYVVLRVWGCITLFMLANLIKITVARILAFRFMASQLAKLNTAIHRELLLKKMMEPRTDSGILKGVEFEEKKSFNPIDLISTKQSALTSAISKKFSFKWKGGASRRSQSTGAIQLTEAKQDVTPAPGGLFSWSKSAKQDRLDSIVERPEDSDGNDDKMLDGGNNIYSMSRASSAGGGITGPPVHGSPPKLEIKIDSGSKSPVRTSGPTSPFALPHATTMPTSTTPSQSKLPTLKLPASVNTFGSSSNKASPYGSPAKGAPPQSPGGKSSQPSSKVATPTAAGATLRHQGSIAARLGISKDPKSPSAASVASAGAAAAGKGAKVKVTMSDTEKGKMISKMVWLGKHVRKNELKLRFRNEQNKVETVTSETETNRLAFYLFNNIKREIYATSLTRDDISDFFESEDDIEEAFNMLDGLKEGKLTFAAVKTAVSQLFVDRRNLAKSLNGQQSIVSVLESIFGFIIHTIFVFFYLLIFGKDVGALYTSLSALILSLSFIFGNSVRQMYENVVFLFMVNAYNIGDMISLEMYGGQFKFYIVDEITLNYTCFSSTTGERVWWPNQKISQNSFINITNSTNRGESIIVLIDFDTPAMLLEEMNAALDKLVKANPKELVSANCQFRDGANPMKMTLGVYYTFTHNGVDLGRTANMRTKVYICVGEVLKKLKVEYSWPAQRNSQQGAMIAGATDTTTGFGYQI